MRGTTWEVYDRCVGTYVEVEHGLVAVDDLKKHMALTVRVRDSYLAHR